MTTAAQQDDGYPDMDAIRDAHNAPRPDVFIFSGSALVDAFKTSMKVDYEKWHDGIGYDLTLLQVATDADRTLIVAELTPANDWRDVEALAAIDTDAARATLRSAIHSSNGEVRTAVLRFAPQLSTDDERTALLVHALQFSAFYGGLTGALDLVASFHPPRVVNALVRGLFTRPGEIACHFAAMLWFIHGKSDDIFDWDMRPLFLEFNSHDRQERRVAFGKLCALLSIDAVAARAAAGEHNED